MRVSLRSTSPLVHRSAAVLHILAATLILIGLTACGGAQSARSDDGSLRISDDRGEASYYADKFEGRQTANGEIYDHSKATAAHRTLPFGTKVRVTRIDTGASVVVRINDRGPFKRGRIIDLSKSAARDLGIVHDGVAEVKLQIVDGSKAPAPANDDQTSTSW